MKKFALGLTGMMFLSLALLLTGCNEALNPDGSIILPTTTTTITTTTTTTTTTTITTTTTTSTTTTTVPGDVNGDGFADVIVGANRADAGGTDRGQAYLFFGGAYVNSSADKLFSGAADSDYLGFSVAIAGDVNGDGFADVIVGAPLADAGGAKRGRAYIYFGGPNMNSTPDIIISGAADSDYLGYLVAGAGDVNGDGFADVIVGAPLADAGGSSRGQAYIYFGGPAMDNIPDVTISGAADGDLLGYSVAGAGDVNGDGFADVIVGVPDAAAGGADRGQAYIYFGGPAMDNIPDVTISGAVDDETLGISVAGAGDVNGDGFADVIVGVPDAAAGGILRGQAHIYFGGAAMDNIPDVTISGAADNDYLGTSVAGAGDVNGDGFADVIVGASGAAAGGTDRGQAYIYFGGPAMDNTSNVTISGAADGDRLGFSAAGAGDINGDGFADVIVGAYRADAGGADRGQAYIYFGGAVMDNLADVTFNGVEDESLFGIAVGGARP